MLGATGGTGRHFVSLALQDGHQMRALVRNLAKLTWQDANMEVQQGSITDELDLDSLVAGVDFVVAMLGDVHLQQHARLNTAFVGKLIPAMRRHGVKRFLYQAGGLSRPYQGQLTPFLWLIRNTLARGYEGQHEDNEAVMAYLATAAPDIEWMVHRAGIGSDGPSKGSLRRSADTFSIATHRDCAAYNYRTVQDAAAIHTCSLSCYEKE